MTQGGKQGVSFSSSEAEFYAENLLLPSSCPEDNGHCEDNSCDEDFEDDKDDKDKDDNEDNNDNDDDVGDD